MSAPPEARTAIEETIDGIRGRPDLAQGTVHSTARIEEGMKCVVSEGNWVLTCGVPPAVGGASEGPSPGVYGRAALSSCVAIGIKIWAARLGLPVHSIQVSVAGDYDWRGDFGLDDVAPGFQRFRLQIDVDSPADTDAVTKLVNTTLATSSWFDVFTRAQVIDTRIHVSNNPRTAAAN